MALACFLRFHLPHNLFSTLPMYLPDFWHLDCLSIYDQQAAKGQNPGSSLETTALVEKERGFLLLERISRAAQLGFTMPLSTTSTSLLPFYSIKGQNDKNYYAQSAIRLFIHQYTKQLQTHRKHAPTVRPHP